MEILEEFFEEIPEEVQEEFWENSGWLARKIIESSLFLEKSLTKFWEKSHKDFLVWIPKETPGKISEESVKKLQQNPWKNQKKCQMDETFNELLEECLKNFLIKSLENFSWINTRKGCWKNICGNRWFYWNVYGAYTLARRPPPLRGYVVNWQAPIQFTTAEL